MASPDVRKTRVPFCEIVSAALPVSTRLATVALAGRFTDLPAMLTKSPDPGTPPGLQLLAVDQSPPVGPTYVLLPQVPSLSRTATVFEFVTAASGRPSRLKSATTGYVP